MKAKKRKQTLTQKASWTGRFFVLPFYVGFVLFLAKPLIETFVFVFSHVDMGDSSGYAVHFTGLENIRHIFTEDLNYGKNLLTSFVDLLWKTPIIVLVSLFIAILLNSRFRGRTLVRAICFLPVIVMTGTVILIIQSDTAASGVLQGGVVASGTIEYGDGLQDILVRSGLNSRMVSLFTTISNSMFNLLWKTGVQMIIFLAGLQSISPSLYEASAIEGASAWENFFGITVPMIMPMILVNMVYTIVDSFTDVSNAVMQQIAASASAIKFGMSAAMSWVYFLLIAVMLALVGLIFSKMAKKVA